ncbi:M48 family metallopeptidase [uncultured Tateyamaria sp.]|uniref:M48 family metallopeptidase n=1 Tax=uncultured Tateyamaria sp. TaxID=455651 RepID=UPI002619BAB2|nr:M48 family metallopeptidase [uncultured Tateyamaria sp.]
MTGPRGRFFDGETGQRLYVDLSLDKAAQTLRLTHPDLPMGAQYWPLDAIRAQDDHARRGQMSLGLAAEASLDGRLIRTARLVINDPDMVAALRVACPNLGRRDMAAGTGRKVMTWVGGAVAAVGLMVFVILPALANVMAALIPIDREIAAGERMVAQIERFLGADASGDLVCDAPAGQAALDAMTAQLTAHTAVEYDLTVTVFNHKMVNAFATMGGQIVLMRGLIDQAQSPDEVAAVLAHEIGHVESRDPTRGALRAAGSAGLLSLVLGDFAGGAAVVVMAEYTLNAAYTREAEGEADQYALRMLDRAGVDAGALGTFFDSLEEIERRMPDLPVYLSSHPETEARADAARDFARGQGPTTPSLSADQWADLRAICAG